MWILAPKGGKVYLDIFFPNTAFMAMLLFFQKFICNFVIGTKAFHVEGRGMSPVLGPDDNLTVMSWLYPIIAVVDEVRQYIMSEVQMH